MRKYFICGPKPQSLLIRSAQWVQPYFFVGFRPVKYVYDLLGRKNSLVSCEPNACTLAPPLLGSSLSVIAVSPMWVGDVEEREDLRHCGGASRVQGGGNRDCSPSLEIKTPLAISWVQDDGGRKGSTLPTGHARALSTRVVSTPPAPDAHNAQDDSPGRTPGLAP